MKLSASVSPRLLRPTVNQNAFTILPERIFSPGVKMLVFLVLAIAAWASGTLLVHGGSTTAGPAVRIQGSLPPAEDLSLVGNAQRLPDRLRLTPAEVQQTGAVWLKAAQPVGGGFETTFQFQLSDFAEGGGDGFAFVVQNAAWSYYGSGGGAEALGGAGGGLGYRSIPNSLAVEFDTWGNRVLSDPNDNHISIHAAANAWNEDNESYSLGSTTELPNFSDGAVHTVRISYGPGSLRVFIDNLGKAVLSVHADLGAMFELDAGKAWVGFTGATYGGRENHDILSWSFVPTPFEICADAIDNEGDGRIDSQDSDCRPQPTSYMSRLPPAPRSISSARRRPSRRASPTVTACHSAAFSSGLRFRASIRT